MLTNQKYNILVNNYPFLESLANPLQFFFNCSVIHFVNVW